jgi:hypothetical protein
MYFQVEERKGVRAGGRKREIHRLADVAEKKSPGKVYDVSISLQGIGKEQRQ